MSGVEAAFARIRALQRDVESLAPATGFDQVLERHIDAPAAAGSATQLGSLRPVSAETDYVTLGAVVGLARPTPQPAPVVGGQGIIGHADLDRYLEVTGVRERNGRLEDHELVAGPGGWEGRTVRLLPPAADAWRQMRAAAASDGIDLQVIDSYRDWATQDRAHRDHLAGRKPANVLPPGRSEHGAGLALDFTNGAIIGRDDPEWRWLQANATRFGWYPISNETWHWEFRGLGA